MPFTQVTVYGTYLQPNSIPATGSVTFTLTAAMTDGTTIIAAAPQQVNLDAHGQFSVPLYATDDPTTSPTNVLYHITEQINSGKLISRGFLVQLTHTLTTVDITDLAPVIPQPDTGSGFATNDYVNSQIAALAALIQQGGGSGGTVTLTDEGDGSDLLSGASYVSEGDGSAMTNANVIHHIDGSATIS